MRKATSIIGAAALCLICQCTSFTVSNLPRQRTHSFANASNLGASPSHTDTSTEQPCQLRRSFLVSSLAALIVRPTVVNGEGKLGDILGQLKEARVQLEEVPELIKQEKWDAGKYL